MMGIAAAMVTLFTGYIGVLFCTSNFPYLPDYYVLSIRIAILLFVFFAFQGASMGARQTHTVGGPEGDAALPVLNWSTRYGDLRIAHFIGMHALQLLPLLSWYVFRNTISTVIVGILYGVLAIYTLVRALQGMPFTSLNQKLRNA
jgi:NO-binding membrane sensor protein with MHYT domain